MALKREEIHIIFHTNPDAIIALIEQQEAGLVHPESRSVELEAQLNQNSQNSNRPPSSTECVQETKESEEGRDIWRRMGMIRLLINTVLPDQHWMDRFNSQNGSNGKADICIRSEIISS